MNNGILLDTERIIYLPDIDLFGGSWTDWSGGIMVSHEKLCGFFELNDARLNNIIDEKYTPEEMVNKLGLDPTLPYCDGYFHHRNCNYFVQECKKKNIKRALEQLESTIEQLRKKGHSVHRIFLFLERLGKRERNVYDFSSQGVLLKKDGSSPYYIQGKTVDVITDKRFRAVEGGQWPFI